MATDWFIKIGDKEIGPFSAQQLKQMGQSGRLAPSYGIRQGSTGPWVRADHVRGLALPVAPTATPVDQTVAQPPVESSDESDIPVATFVPSPPPLPQQAMGVRQTNEELDQWLEERHDLVNVDAWKSEFAAADWNTLFPFVSVLRDRPWSLLWVQFLAFAFCFPFILIKYYAGKETPLLEAAWAFSLYFAILWAAFLHRCMRPETLGKKRVVSTWLFTSFLGVMAVVLITIIASILPGTRDLVQASESASIIPRLVGFTLAVGLVEESVKGVPVMWIGLRSRIPQSPTTVAYIGVISGLAFGAAEAIVYSIQYAMGHAAAALSYGDYLIVQVLRFVSLPLLHAIWSGIFGFFVGFSANSSVAKRTTLLVGLALVAILHGLYNTFSDGWLGLFVAGLSLCLFVGYIRAEAVKAVRLPAECARA